jgi:outer membrane protein assembly factor BamB
MRKGLSPAIFALSLALPWARADDAPAAAAPLSPPTLPGAGLAQHPFLYAGEWDTRKPDKQSMFIVRDGRIVWQYSMPLHNAQGHIQEFDDATLLPNGNVLFSHMSGATEVNRDKQVVWDYPAPPGTEVHSVQAIDAERVLIMRNGNPAEAMIINTATGKVEKEIPIPTTVKATHGQFRHIRMTAAGTILVGHMGEGKVVEYDLDGKVVWSVQAPNVWSAVRLKNGDTLLAGDARAYAREVNPRGETVWEFTQADAPGIKLFNVQTAQRLANGDTVICCWVANDKNLAEWKDSVQVLEVAPDKRIVWALRSWTDPADLGPATSIQLLDEPGSPETPGDQQR